MKIIATNAYSVNIILILLLTGDIELNPDPDQSEMGVQGCSCTPWKATDMAAVHPLRQIHKEKQLKTY